MTMRAILAVFDEAASALITQFVEVGIGDHADIARRLNRRGFPCWGRPRWTAGAVSAVMRRKMRLDEGPRPTAIHDASAKHQAVALAIIAAES